MNRHILTNARLVLPDRVEDGAVVMKDGLIEDILSGMGGFPGEEATDCKGDFLLPGLVDLHTDSLERQLTPRPGVIWPDGLAAAVANDRCLVSQGVTTVLDSLCAEAFPDGPTRRAVYFTSLESVLLGVDLGLFKAGHFLHLRCETADPDVLSMFEPFADSPLLRMASLMDHTPGQRQYRDMAVYRRHYGNGTWDDGEFAAMVAMKLESQKLHAGPHRDLIISLARDRGVPLASHDDATREHVEQAHAEGAAICEFPTTLEAACRARELGMVTVMGAPNIVLGGSHSGNVSAMEALRAGCLDVLSSDYYPPSLLSAPFRLAQTGIMALHDAVRLVTAAPAEAVGLRCRGSLVAGLRADIARVRVSGATPVVMGVWAGGLRVS